jgi:hypothetical protein
MKDLTAKRGLAASTPAIRLILLFIYYYVGLRFFTRNVSVGEIPPYLLAAIARFAIKDHQEKYSLARGLNIDERYSSIGAIQTQKG